MIAFAPSVAAIGISAAVAVMLVAFAVRPLAGPARRVGADALARRSRARPGAGQRGASPALTTTIDLVDDIARSVRSGLSLHTAVRSALASRPGCLPPLPALLRSGATLQEALRMAVDGTIGADGRGRGTRGADDQLVLQTLSACVRSGGDLANPIERAASVLRERRAWHEERRAQSAQARLSATVMTLLPIGFAGWGAATDERVRSTYLTSTVVATCAIVGLALNALGWWWMRRLVGGGAP